MISRDDAEKRFSAQGWRTETEFERAKNISGDKLKPEKLVRDRGRPVIDDTQSVVLCHAFIDGLCATGFASAPILQEALTEPVAHIKTRLTEQ